MVRQAIPEMAPTPISKFRILNGVHQQAHKTGRGNLLWLDVPVVETKKKKDVVPMSKKLSADSDDEKKDIPEIDDLTPLVHVGEVSQQALYDLGLTTIKSVAEAKPEVVAVANKRWSEEQIQDIIEAAKATL